MIKNDRNRQRASQRLNQREARPLSFAASHPRSALEYMKSRLGLDPIGAFFFAALFHQFRASDEGWSPVGPYYEFGVGWGRTLTKYIKALKAFCGEYRQDIGDYPIFGFDSFEGLPEPAGEQDKHPSWPATAFAHSLPEIERQVTSLLPAGGSGLRLIKGFYEDSLTPQLRQELQPLPPAIVTIDVDFYSSAKTVLEWLRPLLASGTIFYFDDIWAFHGNPAYGELAAIREFNAQADGQLTPFPILGLDSYVYIYSRKEFEYAK